MSDHFLSHSNSFGFEMGKDAAGCRAFNRNFIVGGETNMRCPWCGNPATTHGDWWECYYCGDSGNLRGTPVQQPAQITLTLSFVYHVDLPETWSNLKKELNQIAPKNALLSQLLGKVLLLSLIHI